MTTQEKLKHIRDITMSPFNKITEALNAAGGDVDKAIEALTNAMSKTDIAEMENRTANATIVYSYVHNNRIGALLSIACQTDFVAKNELFLGLAKDICMHIVSTPIPPEYVSKGSIPVDVGMQWMEECSVGLEKKPDAIRAKIVDGKYQKRLTESCLLYQPFIKDDSITIEQLIANVSAQTREKIEVKKFVRMVAS